MFKFLKKKRELEEVEVRWIETLVKSSLKATVGSAKDNTLSTFELYNIKKIRDGYKAITYAPPGLEFSDLEKNIGKLEASFGGMVIVEPQEFSKKIFVNIITKKPCFDYTPVKAFDNKFFLGYKPHGAPYFADLNIDNNFLIAGMRGQGKTVFALTLITNCMHFNKYIDFYFLQIKKNEMEFFNDAKNTKRIDKTVAAANKTLSELNSLINKRAKQMLKLGKGIDSISKYNENVDKNKRMRRIFVVVEEMSFFMDSKDALISDCWENMKGIVKAGRSVGIGLIGLTQRTTAENLDPNVKSQLSRMTFKQESNIDSINVIDTNDATTLKSRELICKVGGYNKLIAPTVDKYYKSLIDCIPKTEKKEDEIAISSIENKNNDCISFQCSYTRDELLEAKKTGKSILEIRAAKVLDIKKSDENNVETVILKNDRDRYILKFIEQYGACTLDNLHKIFFYKKENPKSSYSSCSRRLKQLEEKGVLKSYVLEENKKKVYYITKKKTLHDLNCLNFYANIKTLNANILEFKLTPHLLNNKIIPDFYIKFEINGSMHEVYGENDYTHYTSQFKINLYENVEGNFKILIGKDDEIKIKSSKIKILKTNTSFADAEKLFIA